MKRNCGISFLIASALLLGQLTRASAQEPSVVIGLERDRIQIGEQILLQFEITAPVAQDVHFPALSDTLTKSIEILEVSPMDTIYPEEDVTIKIFEQTLRITSFDSGYHVIPPILFTIGGKVVNSSPALLSVQLEPIEETAELKDIKPPIDVSFSFLEWLFDNWKWLLGIYVFIGLLLVYWKFFYNQPQKEEEVEVVELPKIPIDQEALNLLEALEAKKLWQAGQIKKYHSEVTEIIRAYIEKRYQVNALELTSEEIFTNLRHVELEESTRQQLRQLLVTADMVKFAKEKPGATENELSYQNAIAFIKATRPSISLAEPTETPA